MEINNNDLKNKHLVFSNKIEIKNYQIFNFKLNHDDIENHDACKTDFQNNSLINSDDINYADALTKHNKLIMEGVYEYTNESSTNMEVDEQDDDNFCYKDSNKRFKQDNGEQVKLIDNIYKFQDQIDASNSCCDLDTIEMNQLNLNENIDSISSIRQYALNLFHSALTSKTTLESSLEVGMLPSSIDSSFAVFNLDQNNCDKNLNFSKKNSHKRLKLSSTSPTTSNNSSRSSSNSRNSESLLINQNINTTFLSNLSSNNYNDSTSSYLELKPVNQLFNYNLNNLNITRKDTLLYLIERNKNHKIYAPFDSFIYSKLSQKNKYIISFSDITHNFSLSNDDQTENLNNTYIYNYLDIKKLTKLHSNLNFNPMDDNFLKHNSLMPNCLSTLMMPFFFDFFSMSDLNKFDKDTLNMINILKKAYVTKQYLDYQLMTNHITENLVWNCISLYKFKFRDSLQNRIGYLNFYLTYLYMEIYLRKSIQYINNDLNPTSKSCIFKLEELNYMLPFFLEALVLNGLFKQCDYIKIKKFLKKKLFFTVNQNEQRNSQNLKIEYLTSCLRNLESRIELGNRGCIFPLKLKDLCRHKLKSYLNTYGSNQIQQLNIPKSVINYSNFDDELKKIYLMARNFLNCKK